MLSRVTGKNCTFPSFHPFNIKWWAAKIGSDFKERDVLQVTEWLFYFTYWIRAGYQSATKEPQVFTKKRGSNICRKRSAKTNHLREEPAFYSQPWISSLLILSFPEPSLTSLLRWRLEQEKHFCFKGSENSPKCIGVKVIFGGRGCHTHGDIVMPTLGKCSSMQMMNILHNIIGLYS